MAEPNAKRARLSMTDVLLELDNEDDEPMTVGSDDEFEDITYIEKERDEWGAVEHEITKETNPILSHFPLYPSDRFLAQHSLFTLHSGCQCL